MKFDSNAEMIGIFVTAGLVILTSFVAGMKAASEQTSE